MVEVAVGLVGGLALFLYGVHKMSDGMKAAAGEGMKRMLARLTGNRFSGAATGAVVTALIQSSSVTTVLVVGFVSAGVMTLSQSVGVIMGANVGTTITAQIVAFKVTKVAWLLVAVGFASWSFGRRDALRNWGAMLLGLGMLFLGMGQMSEATSPLRAYPPFVALMQRLDQPLLGILVGAGFTALVQSSSATIGVVIVLASQGFLTLEAGIALAIGANVGTCVTAVLASVGSPAEAVRAAIVHVLFNVAGALIWLAFIPELAEAARLISPAYAGLAGNARLAAETPRQIANANTLFNVANTALLIWFTGPIARLAEWLVPARVGLRPEVVVPKYLDAIYLQTPALALDRMRMELGHLGEYVLRMIESAPRALAGGSMEELRRVAAMDDDVDTLHRAILAYARDLGRLELTAGEARRLANWLSVANYLEETGDLIATEVVAQGVQRLEKHLRVSPGTQERTRPLFERVAGAMRDALRALADNDPVLARRVLDAKPGIVALAAELKDHLARRLLTEEPNRLDTFRVESDFVEQLRRTYSNARQIAKIVASGEGAE
jgi:phosphate:Na+ symporter